VAAESFFARWSRQKAAAGGFIAPSHDAPGPDLPAPQESAAEPDPETRPLVTLEQVAQLTPDSDFSPFMARGVDEGVRRAAMKKLFADPRFNVMDGLDTYIDDYNKFVPLTPLMVAALNHAKSLVAREFEAKKEEDDEPKDESL